MREGEFRLTPSERRELRDRLRSRTLPAEDVRRARLILLLAQGRSYLAIRQVLGCNPNYISRWKGRFEAERLAGLTQLRVFGLRPSMAMTAGQIAAAARAAGLAEVEVTVCGDRVIAPALRLAAARLAGATAAPAGQQTAARLLLRQVDLLWRRQIIDYLLLRAVRP